VDERLTTVAGNPERERYERMWGIPEYRAISPGEQLATIFLMQAKPKKGAEVTDFGCGTGRGGLALHRAGLNVRLTDFASNCLDPEVREALGDKFEVADLTQPLSWHSEYGYCCDVLEHISTADVRTVLGNILATAQHCFFAISTVPDHFGPATGSGALHLTVQPLSWWREQLSALGALVHWAQEEESYCWIYCTAWKDVKDLIDGRINISPEMLEEQVLTNIRAGWQMAQPHLQQEREVVMLAGGPSMNDFIDDIRKHRESGAALVTMNGSYHWALERGLTPSMQIVLDARQFNCRFTKPVNDQTKYLIASQVHPDTLAGLPHDNTYLFHSGISETAQELVREKYGIFHPVPGGSTVMLRALPLLLILGFSKFRVYGFDSCLAGDRHHAYAQTENDSEVVLPVRCGGRLFYCAPWMLAQASEFREVVGLFGDHLQMEVTGDGLIRHMLETGAQLASGA